MQIFLPPIRVDLQMATTEGQLKSQLDAMAQFGWAPAGPTHVIKTVDHKVYARIIINTLSNSKPHVVG